MVRAVQTNPAPDGKDRLGTTQTKTDSIWVASGLQRVSGIKNWGVQVEWQFWVLKPDGNWTDQIQTCRKLPSPQPLSSLSLSQPQICRDPARSQPDPLRSVEFSLIYGDKPTAVALLVLSEIDCRHPSQNWINPCLVSLGGGCYFAPSDLVGSGLSPNPWTGLVMVWISNQFFGAWWRHTLFYLVRFYIEHLDELQLNSGAFGRIKGKQNFNT